MEAEVEEAAEQEDYDLAETRQNQLEEFINKN